MTPERLTRREAEVLAAVERRLTNAEIAALHHVSVRTVESQIAALRRKLGVDSRAGLVAAARHRRPVAVPVPRNSFVGREADLEALGYKLRAGRWVTVVGPPGVGKSRLVLELAARTDHTVLIDFTTVPVDGVVGAVAKAAGVVADGTEPVVSAGVALSARPTLLVLDSCDRVAGQVAALVPRLMALAPSLRVIGTSLGPVGAADETLHVLGPLDGTGPASPAAALFRDRCRAQIGAAADGLSDEVVERVCRRVDGLPLALELAAARVRHLGAEVTDRLATGLVPLAATFAWTWDLLDPEEQRVLARLASLPLSFDLDLAGTVCGPGAAEVVLRLLDRSLVVVADPACTPRRFRLLEPLRDLVRDRTDDDLRHDVRRLHAEHHAAVADRVHRRARTDDSHESAVAAKRVCPEVNAAVRWALGRDPHLVLRLVTALAVGGEQYGPDVTSLDAIARAARDEQVRAVATPAQLLELGIALCYTDLALVEELAALALERAGDSPGRRLAAHHLAGWAAAYAHRGADALAHLEEAERLADELLEPWQLASVRQARGIALRDLGEPAAALAAFESSMRAYALAGDALHVNNTRYMMAVTAAGLPGHEDRVLTWAEQCIAYGRETHNDHELAHGLLTRARVTGGAAAETDLEAATATFRAVGDLRCLTRSHVLLAERRSPDAAVPLLEEALRFATRANDRDRQADVLARLTHARWLAGDRRGAALDLGRLGGLLGDEAAAARAPAALVDATRGLGELEPAVAEGRARGL